MLLNKFDLNLKFEVVMFNKATRQSCQHMTWNHWRVYEYEEQNRTTMHQLRNDTVDNDALLQLLYVCAFDNHILLNC